MKSPAFQFYPDDYMGGRPGLFEPNETHVFMWLMCLDWNRNGFVFEPDVLARWCRVPRKVFDRAWPAVSECFIERDGRLYNPRLDQERAKQAEWREKSSKGGKISAEHRAKQKATTLATVVEPPYQPEGQPNGNTPFPTPVTTTTGGASRGRKKPKASTDDDLPDANRLWVAEAGDDWKTLHGGLPNYGKLAGLLANAVKAFGWDVVRPKWQRFLRSDDAKFGPAYFVEHMGNYEESGPSRVVGSIPNAEAEHVWELCKRYGFHHCTRSTIDGELERARDAGDIDDPEAFKATLRKLDVQFLREARSDGAAVASIAKRLAA